MSLLLIIRGVLTLVSPRESGEERPALLLVDGCEQMDHLAEPVEGQQMRGFLWRRRSGRSSIVG
jgi:hypothetical protein